MKIIRAEHLGMCFGVRDAIAMAKDIVRQKPLTILGELVHNEVVLDDLRKKGIQIEQDTARIETATVMITAHGASEHKLQSVRESGFNVLEATCPLVRFAHRSLFKLVGQGYHPVIIGKRDHVEVRGMTEDLNEFDVLLTEAEVAQLKQREKFGIVSQTTQPIEKVQRIVALIRSRFPGADVRFVDTVCQPTKQRQTAAIDVARQSDVVIVVGGAHSNNTRELVATCSLHCSRVHHVQGASDLDPTWFTNAHLIGLTAGTSTPDEVIGEVELAIQRIDFPNAVTVNA